MVHLVNANLEETQMSHHLDPSVATPVEVALPNRDDRGREPQQSSALNESVPRSVPIWRCGAFAAEFADAVISDTDLEGGTIEGGELLTTRHTVTTAAARAHMLQFAPALCRRSCRQACPIHY